jgi:hypothetical protein
MQIIPNRYFILLPLAMAYICMRFIYYTRNISILNTERSNHFLSVTKCITFRRRKFLLLSKK